MTHKTLSKICLAISGSSIVYMFLITYEGTYFGWIIFFVFMAFASLFHELDEKEDKIAILGLPKENKQEKEKRLDEHLKELAETDPRSSDPFYISDKFNPNYQKLMGKKLKEKETNSSRIEESEIVFIQTLHTGMNEKWGKTKTSETMKNLSVDK